MNQRNVDYVDETGSCISNGVPNQSCRDKIYQILKHQKEKEFTGSQYDRFKNFGNNWGLKQIIEKYYEFRILCVLKYYGLKNYDSPWTN